MHHAVFIHETVFVQPREIVGFGQSLAVCLFGEAALEDDAEEGGGLLARLEECPLPQLRFRLAVIVLRWQLARIGASEAGVVNLTADGARVFDERWFYLCLIFLVPLYGKQRRNKLFIALLP